MQSATPFEIGGVIWLETVAWCVPQQRQQHTWPPRRKSLDVAPAIGTGVYKSIFISCQSVPGGLMCVSTEPSDDCSHLREFIWWDSHWLVKLTDVDQWPDKCHNGTSSRLNLLCENVWIMLWLPLLGGHDCDKLIGLAWWPDVCCNRVGYQLLLLMISISGRDCLEDYGTG